MATGSMLEGVYVCIVRRVKRGEFEPCLTKVKLMLGQNFLLDLPYHLFRRRGSNQETIMQPYQGLCWVASNECTNGVLNNCGFKVL